MLATMAIVGKYAKAESIACRMGFNEIRTLYNAGWEIAGHATGKTQGWLVENDITKLHYRGCADSFHSEVGECYQLLADTLGFWDIKTWVYPNGFWSPDYARVVGEYYRYGIVVGSTIDTRRSHTIPLSIDQAYGWDIDRGALGYGAIFDPLNVPRVTNKLTRAALYEDIHETINAWGAGQIFMAHAPCSTRTSGCTLNDELSYPWYWLIATLDTLRAEGLCEVVTAGELLDRLCSRPIAPGANWIDGRMKDADGDGAPNGIHSEITADWSPSGPAPRHHVGRFPLEYLGEVQSDTIGVDGGDVWGLCSTSQGLGFELKPIATMAVDPGDIVEMGAYFCVVDSFFGDGTHQAGDSSIYHDDFTGLMPYIWSSAFSHYAVMEDSSALGAFVEQTTGNRLKSTKKIINDAGRTYQWNADDTVWLHVYEQFRAREWYDLLQLRVEVAYGSAPIDSIENKIVISSPYVHVKKRTGVKW